jgi:hypothetical protein
MPFEVEQADRVLKHSVGTVSCESYAENYRLCLKRRGERQCMKEVDQFQACILQQR